jgi:hypothetical protein
VDNSGKPNFTTKPSQQATPSFDVSERSTHASIPAVSELLRRQPTLPIEATKHTKVRSKPLKLSLKLASQSLAWMHQPRDPTIGAVASCTAVTFGPKNIHCQVSFKSQILPSHKILAFASDLRQPLKALIWSVQIGTNTSAPKLREDLRAHYGKRMSSKSL